MFIPPINSSSAPVLPLPYTHSGMYMAGGFIFMGENTINDGESFSGEFTVFDNSTLNLNNTSIPPAFYSSTIRLKPSCNLALLAADQLGNEVNLIFDGGMLTTNKMSPTASSISLGTLTVNQSSTIDCGTGPGGSVFTFSALEDFDSTQILTIKNWSGHLAGNGRDQIIFTDPSRLTPEILACIRFEGYSQVTQLLNTGELVPISLVAGI